MDPLGSDMLVDSDYEEKQPDVAIISPDDSMEEPETLPRADDFEAMRNHWMPELPELETESEAYHTWDIESWRTMPKRNHGPGFSAGGHPFRVLFFPAGNNANGAVSFYLEQGHADGQAPENWYACAQFMIVLWNPNDPSIYVHHEATHRFTTDEGDWGFTQFSDKNKTFAAKFEDHDRPLVEGDRAKVTAYVRIIKDSTGVLWHNFVNYDSKKETGMVGLRNQGATCYLNSLIQSLYFTNAFRKAVYQIPTESEADPRQSSAWSLQRLFYKLQTDPVAVSTAELTQSFGWDSRQIFEQQDVQELSRILMEKMEEKMKGTEAENALAQMFVGKMKTYLKCINVDYESSRVEDYWDLQMNVSGCKTLADSFSNYVEVETLEGDNKYHAEGFGLQDAKKGVIFESFPSVLHLQLKRFEYDFVRDMMVKVNDRYEFPEVFDASPYLSETADRSEPYIYHLHGVLVHSGDMNAGHYYAFLKTKNNGDFFKFDDDRVTRATKREAIEENYGGDYIANGTGTGPKMQNPYSRTWSTKRSMSAYMLVYIRQSRIESILPSSETIEPPQHLPARLHKERAEVERKRKEREEAHLYMNVSYVTEANYKSWHGIDLVSWDSPDTPEEDSPTVIKVLKTCTIGELMHDIAAALGVGAEFIRPWSVVKRQNETQRPDQPLMQQDMTIAQAMIKTQARQGILKLFIEQSSNPENGLVEWAHDTTDVTPENKGMIIFLKHFDVEHQELRGVGHVYMTPSERVQDIADPILQIMKWPVGTSLKLFEEIKSNLVEPMKSKQTLHQSEIQDGDIICFQRVYDEAEVATILERCPTAHLEAPGYYEYLVNRIQVSFGPRPGAPQTLTFDPAEDSTFKLYLSKKEHYDIVTAHVANHLTKVSGTTVDATHLRFTTVTAGSLKPRLTIKRTPNATLSTMLSSAAGGYGDYNYSGTQTIDALYYEVLEMSLADMEQRKLVRITLLSEGVTKQDVYEFFLSKQGVIGDLVPALQTKASLPDETIEQLRFVEVSNGRIYKLLTESTPVSGINEYTTIYAERTPEDELNIDRDEHSRQITCFHYEKETSRHHGVPFVFVIKDDEAFRDTRERLSKRCGIKGKQFEKIKVSVVRGSPGRPTAIDDDDVLADIMSGDDSLGLEHLDKTRNNWSQHERLNIR